MFALAALVNVVALYLQHPVLAEAAKPIATGGLLLAFVASVRSWSVPMGFTAAAISMSWIGDTLPRLSPATAQLTTALAFLAAMIAYSVALAPMWARRRDPLRMLLAIPYAGVIIGLFVACADGAGSLLPAMVVYAVALAIMAFLSAGVNALTWVGGTLFLLCSSVLGMDWFLPGAWVPFAGAWVMLSYFGAQTFLVLGILRTRPRTARDGGRRTVGGATLVIVES